MAILLRSEEDFAELYGITGLPNFSVARMLGLCFLQELNRLSDQALYYTRFFSKTAPSKAQTFGIGREIELGHIWLVDLARNSEEPLAQTWTPKLKAATDTLESALDARNAAVNQTVTPTRTSPRRPRPPSRGNSPWLPLISPKFKFQPLLRTQCIDGPATISTISRTVALAIKTEFEERTGWRTNGDESESDSREAMSVLATG